MRDEATHPVSVAHHDGKYDDASHIGIDGSVADSEYSSPLCNPRVSSLRADASSRAIVDIDDSVANTNNLAPPLPIPTFAIPTRSISPDHIQDRDLRWNLSSPQMPGYLSPQDASPSRGRSPCCSPISGYLPTSSTTSSSGLSGLFSNDSVNRTIPAQYRRVVVTAEDVREIAVHRHPFQIKSLSVGGPIRDRL